MIKRYPCQVALLAILGILSMYGLLRCRQADAALGGAAAFGAAACAVLLAGICVRQESSGQRKTRQAVILLLAFAAGAARMYVVSDAMERRLAGILDGQEVSVQGRVIKKQSQETNNQTILWTVRLSDSYLKTSQGIRSCGKIIVYTDLKSGEPVIGNTIFLTGKTKLWDTARNEGNFDECAYYKNQGYSFKIYADKNSYQAMDSRRDSLREFLYTLRQKLIRVYQSGMQEQEAGAVCAMILGEKSLLAAETKALYRQSGIAHILAISGLHISVLGAAVFRFLRKRGVSYAISSAVSMGWLLLFGIMAGMGLSTLRAVVMFGIYLGAACCGRAYDSMNALAAAAVWILWQNPCSLFLAGFQFSFAAVAGVLSGKLICQAFRPKYRLYETILISLGIQMLTLPLTVWYYYEIPVYSILLNLLVLPLMGMVLVSGLSGGACGLLACSGIGIVAAVGEILSKGLLGLCSLLLGFFSRAGKLFLTFPGAVYTSGQPCVWQMAGYCLILAMCIIRLTRSQQEQPHGAGRREQPYKAGIPEHGGKLICSGKPYSGKGSGKTAAIITLAASLGMLLFRLPMRAEVVFLDVGQGDGIYIHTSDGMDVMVDGGSTDVKQAGTYRILPFLKSRGITGIDCWFLSHLDQDHISGFMEIVESGYPVGEVVCSGGIVKDEAYEKVTDLLAFHQIKIRYLEKGDILRGEKAGFYCLAPDTDGPADDRNANSLVLLYEDSGFCGFFSGDVSQKEELALQKDSRVNFDQVTFYKAAHHGSTHSNAEALLEQLKPQISVVSCSKENKYGHPGEEAVANMEKYSRQVEYTMRSGQIRILLQTDGVAIQKYIE